MIGLNFIKSKACVFGIGFLLISSAINAKISSETWNQLDQETRDYCTAVSSIQMPLKDIPSKEELLKMSFCDSEYYYYGFEFAPAYKKARFCAYELNDNHILSMIYANGFGVKQNLNLALHYLCLIDGLPDEMVYMVNALIAMKKENSSQIFELCDYKTSHNEIIKCYEIGNQKMLMQVKHWNQKTVKNFTKKERTLFKAVQNFSYKYFELRTDNELDKSGREAARYQEHDRIELIIKHTKLVATMSSCHIKEYTEQEYHLADNIMNRIYKQISKGTDNSWSYNVEGIKKTQRAWLQYKLALEKLGASRCPKVNRFTWSTILTKQRLRQLKEIRLDQKEREND